MLKFNEIGLVAVVGVDLVTESDMRYLNECRTDDRNPVIAYKYEDGYFVHINSIWGEDEPSKLRDFGYSRSFVAMYAACIEQDIQFLRLDCDGGSISLG